MSKKTLLNEATVRQFMKYANIGGLASGFVNEMYAKEEELEEAAKPDFPDVDGDGDTKEPISKASKEKKEKEGGDKKDKDLSKVPPQLRKHVGKKMNEAQIRRVVRAAFKKAFSK